MVLLFFLHLFEDSSLKRDTKKSPVCSISRGMESDLAPCYGSLNVPMQIHCCMKDTETPLPGKAAYRTHMQHPDFHVKQSPLITDFIILMCFLLKRNVSEPNVCELVIIKFMLAN